jgi:hypothetical protein
MNLYDEFFSVTSMLLKLGIRYVVVGVIALAFHGRPRFTRGVDFLLYAGGYGSSEDGHGKTGF